MAKLCVIGPLDIGQYSKSPLIHTFLLKQAKIKGKYLAIGSTNLPTTIKQLIHQKYHGFNLTIPHKIAILPCLNKIDHAAQKIGAVNTVKIIDGKLFGYNTDASGAVAYLADKINIKKIKHPLIIGAGGAARALIYGLKYIQKINDITILNRTDKKAQLLAKEFKIKCCKWAKRNALNKYDLIINATAAGMHNREPLDINLANADKKAVIYDVVYAPLLTPFLQQAKKYHLQTVDGLGMLIYQAITAFNIWFDTNLKMSKKLYITVKNAKNKA